MAVKAKFAQPHTLETSGSILVAAFYKFVALPDYAALRDPLTRVCKRHEIKGTILLAGEGINGTIAGSPSDVEAVLQFVKSDPRFHDLEHKASWTETTPFERLKIRLKREIVTLGVPGVSPTKAAGQYVDAREWNRLLDDPNVVVVDVRNDYEVALGTFKRALNPRTKSFREFPAWARNEPKLRDKPKVAMFCTGGIRCEKSTALLKSAGFNEVYHLQGGILKYLETIPTTDNRFEGDCFVFDERVALADELRPSAELCRSCCAPIEESDKTSEKYVPGLSCPRCFDGKAPDKQSALRERRRQLMR